MSYTFPRVAHDLEDPDLAFEPVETTSEELQRALPMTTAAPVGPCAEQGPATDLPCFVRGTSIATIRGAVAVEDLQMGDRVLTRDNGFQPIRWTGCQRMKAAGKSAPVVIVAGALGTETDLAVSPLHNVLLTGWKSELITGEQEVLVPAKHLIDGTSICRRPGGMVDYFHLLFDEHQVILSNGAFTESFHPAHTGLSAFDEDVRAEICDIFPEFADQGVGAYGSVARRILKSHETVLLSDL